MRRRDQGFSQVESRLIELAVELTHREVMNQSREISNGRVCYTTKEVWEFNSPEIKQLVIADNIDELLNAERYPNSGGDHRCKDRGGQPGHEVY